MSGVIILRCSICDSEMQADEQQCLKCQAMENKVQVLTAEEKEHFNGITLEQGHDQQGEDYRNYQKFYDDSKIYNTHIKIVQPGLLAKLAIGIVLAALLALIVFVALPIVFVVIGIAFFSLYFARK